MTQRPDFLPTLHNMDEAQLGRCIAHAAGLLAHQTGEGAAALILRRVANSLDRPATAREAG